MLLPPIPRNLWRSIAILLLAGYAGNDFSLPLFFGGDFLFGSIAVLLVVSFLALVGELSPPRSLVYTRSFSGITLTPQSILPQSG
jgi:hypothetical protein